MKNAIHFGRNSGSQPAGGLSDKLAGTITCMVLIGVSVFWVLAAVVGLVIAAFGIMLGWNLVQLILSIIRLITSS